jgi:hypothetical protein
MSYNDMEERCTTGKGAVYHEEYTFEQRLQAFAEAHGQPNFDALYNVTMEHLNEEERRASNQASVH